MTDPERDAAVREIRHDILGVRTLMRWLLIVVFGAMALMSATGVITVRVSNQGREVSQQNRAFLTNFSDYMRCLIVTDQEAVKAYGFEKYFNLCDDLLFRDTKIDHTLTKVTIPTTVPPTAP